MKYTREKTDDKEEEISSLKKTDEQENSENKLIPEIIIGKLFYFHSQAHFNHLQTTSYSEHKALHELYSELIDFKDSIGELLLGYIAPERFKSFINEDISITISNEELVTQIKDFADEIYEYGESTKWWQLSNKAAELSGLANKINYFLTLK